jgi:hypothetical protein
MLEIDSAYTRTRRAVTADAQRAVETRPDGDVSLSVLLLVLLTNRDHRRPGQCREHDDHYSNALLSPHDSSCLRMVGTG